MFFDTDPFNQDTDNNGISDGNEDPDGDGFTSNEEKAQSRDALNASSRPPPEQKVRVRAWHLVQQDLWHRSGPYGQAPQYFEYNRNALLNGVVTRDAFHTGPAATPEPPPTDIAHYAPPSVDAPGWTFDIDADTEGLVAKVGLLGGFYSSHFLLPVRHGDSDWLAGWLAAAKRFELVSPVALLDPVLQSYVICETTLPPEGDPVVTPLRAFELTLPEGQLTGPRVVVDEPPPAIGPAGRHISLTAVELYTDMNNDGRMDDADAGWTNYGYRTVPEPSPNATQAEIAAQLAEHGATIDKGTEFIFVNDALSNGAWDKEDPDAPGTTTTDDDAERLVIQTGLYSGKCWLEHPAIAGLKFYRESTLTNEVTLTQANPTILDTHGDPTGPWTLHMRAEGPFTFPDPDNPQIEGDLKLMVQGPSGGPPVEAAKMKLTVVQGLGATKHHLAAIDYINEKNTTNYTNRLTAVGTVFDRHTYYAIMNRSRTELFGINAGPSALKGITEVKNSAAWKEMSAIINATYNYDETTPDNGFVHLHAGEQYVRSHTDPTTLTHWDQTCSFKLQPRLYLAFGGSGIFAFGSGHVPTTASDGAGALKTESDIAASLEAYSLVSFIQVGDLELICVASSEWSLLDGETAGKFHTALKSGTSASTIIHCDGGRNVALATGNETATGMTTRIEGPAHLGSPFTRYPKTYLGFKSTKVRP